MSEQPITSDVPFGLVQEESPESVAGCFGDYGNPIAPNVCKTCEVEVQCLRATMETDNQ